MKHGLYILSNEVLDKLEIIKIGMSERLEERVFDYDATFTNNYYKYIYDIISPQLNHGEILYLESLVLTYTKEYTSKYFVSEYRTISKENSPTTSPTIEVYHNLICNTLKNYHISFNIIEHPTFEKKTYINNESTDRTNELNELK